VSERCAIVCPVKIDAHERIYSWRLLVAEAIELPLVVKRRQ
jgi:hypothetical protein